MDEIDRKLLAILQEDATLSIAQLAGHVGLSPTPCWKRIQKLELTGVITRRVALVAPDRVGMGLTVFVAVEAGDHTPEWLERFASAVAAMPAVMELYRMAGEDDYMLRVAVADMAEFDALYKQLIAIAPLKKVTSRFAMERLKSTTAYPLQADVFRERRVVETRKTWPAWRVVRSDALTTPEVRARETIRQSPRGSREIDRENKARA